jgi:hypothetical protein
LDAEDGPDAGESGLFVKIPVNPPLIVPAVAAGGINLADRAVVVTVQAAAS